MDRLNDKRLILSDFYRKEVVRLRNQLQDVLENSLYIKDIFENIVKQEFHFNIEDPYNKEKLNRNYFYSIKRLGRKDGLQC